MFSPWFTSTIYSETTHPAMMFTSFNLYSRSNILRHLTSNSSYRLQLHGEKIRSELLTTLSVSIRLCLKHHESLMQIRHSAATSGECSSWPHPQHCWVLEWLQSIQGMAANCPLNHSCPSMHIRTGERLTLPQASRCDQGKALMSPYSSWMCFQILEYVN